MIGLRKQKQDIGVNPCKDRSTLNKKTDDNRISVEVDDKNKTSHMIKDTNILKTGEGEARGGKKGPGQRIRVSDGGGNAPK